MSSPKIYESEYRFCCILWENEPVGSTELVRLCSDRLGWSKATTYTVIRRLCQRGVVKNENAVVSAIVTREQAQIADIDELVEKRFGGSLPSFVAALSRKKKLTPEQEAEIMRIIDSAGE